MKHRIVTETGRVIKDNLTEREAEKFWEMFDGIWTDYDDNDREYYIYIEEVA